MIFDFLKYCLGGKDNVSNVSDSSDAVFFANHLSSITIFSQKSCNRLIVK